MAGPVTKAAVTVLLKQAGFPERIVPQQGRRRPSLSADGFQVFAREDGNVLVCWIPSAGQDPGNLDAFSRSYDMAKAYAAKARNAGWAAERWGVIWHYALIKEMPAAEGAA